MAAFLWSYSTWHALAKELGDHARSVDSEHGRESWSTPLVIGTSVLAALLATILSGVRHDHISYIKQWAVINAGNSPWSEPSNTYFPLHAFLAPLASIHPLLIKFLFTLITIGCIFLSALGPVSPTERLTHQAKLTLFIAVSLCPLIISVVYLQGTNDSLAGSLLFLALILSAGKKPGRKAELFAGILIGLGACLKVYPLLVAPFFVVRERRIRWSFLSACAATLAIVFSIAFSLWRDSILEPFRIAGNRGATFLSPFNALSHLGIDASQYSSILMLLALGLFFIYYLIRDIDFPTAVLIGLALPLLFYRVGHTGFLTYVAIFTPFMVRHWSSLFDNRATGKLSAALLAWMGFLNWFQLQSALNCGMTLDTPSRIFRDHGAWPYSIVLALTFATFMRQFSPSLSWNQIKVRGSDSQP